VFTVQYKLTFYQQAYLFIVNLIEIQFEL
jgi:hypothetical protein